MDESWVQQNNRHSKKNQILVLHKKNQRLFHPQVWFYNIRILDGNCIIQQLDWNSLEH